MTTQAYPFTAHPTLADLLARRAECVAFALATYRRERACHPSDAYHRDEWRRARVYWIQQAYHAHGEIMARRDSSAWY